MGAAAQQPLGPQQTPGHGRRQIPLAQVHPVGVHRQGQIHAVVDQEQGPVAGAESAQGPGLLQALQIGEGLAVGIEAALLGPVLHQPHAAGQGRLHPNLQIRQRPDHQIEVALAQARPPLGAQPIDLEQLQFEVVEEIADRRRLRRQLRVGLAAEFLQHPQGLLHAGGIGGHHGARLQALGLGGVGHAGGRIAGGVARLFVATVVAPAEPLAQVLGAGHQIGPVEAEAGPVLHHSQALTGAVEVGIEQAQHAGGGVGSRAGRRDGVGLGGGAGLGSGRNHGGLGLSA